LSGKRQRKLWPWVIIGASTLVVLLFLGSFIWRMLHPPILPYVESEGTERVIQLDVVNASGINGAGRRALEFFRERGFDVVEISTSSNEIDSSYVVDRVGDRASALKVARVFGIADSLVRTEIDSMLFVHASVVLGKNVPSLQPTTE
jgi:hypothetical protein